jgi:hypothetical protein
VPAPTPEAPDAQCARAGANIASVLHVDAEHMPALAAVVEHHCRADAWTPAAQACVVAAIDHAAALECAYEHLTEQQHDLVVRDMKVLLPPPSNESAVAPAEGGTQAEIAAREDTEGKQLMQSGRAADASARFRDAAARVPEPAYFFDLCSSLHDEGKFGEALTACNAALQTTDGNLRERIDKLMARIQSDVKAQGLELRH